MSGFNSVILIKKHTRSHTHQSSAILMYLNCCSLNCRIASVLQYRQKLRNVVLKSETSAFWSAICHLLAE